jgi:hypothetical protein
VSATHGFKRNRTNPNLKREPVSGTSKMKLMLGIKVINRHLRSTGGGARVEEILINFRTGVLLHSQYKIYFLSTCFPISESMCFEL